MLYKVSYYRFYLINLAIFGDFVAIFAKKKLPWKFQIINSCTWPAPRIFHFRVRKSSERVMYNCWLPGIFRVHSNFFCKSRHEIVKNCQIFENGKSTDRSLTAGRFIYKIVKKPPNCENIWILIGFTHANNLSRVLTYYDYFKKE